MNMDTKTLLTKILSNPEEDLRLFDNAEEIELYEKTTGKYYLLSASKEESERLVYHEEDGIKKKCAPEEIVRQLWLYKLNKHYKYPFELIETEKSIHFGREIHSKAADIVVNKKDNV